MHNTIYEESGGSYTQVGDYLLPDLLPGNEESAVGIWGRRHARWLRQRDRTMELACSAKSLSTAVGEIAVR